MIFFGVNFGFFSYVFILLLTMSNIMLSNLYLFHTRVESAQSNNEMSINFTIHVAYEQPDSLKDSA